MAEQIEVLRARANLYRLFGALLYREPAESWLESFQQGLKQEWSALGCTFDEDMDMPLPQLKEELDAEFTSLWIAPGGVPRFESVYATGSVFQYPCDQVMEIYRSEGFDFDADAEKTFADHAGVELEFMGLLADKQAKAVEQGDQEEAARAEERLRGFLLEHAGKWIPAMLSHSIRCAEHSFYRELCRMILEFFDQEIEAMLPRRDREMLRAKYQRLPKEIDYDADFRKASGL